MTPMAAVLVAAVVFSAFPPRIAAQRAQKDGRSWNTSHIALASAFSIALWIDAGQTREAMRRGYRETNPILGPHPSVGQVNTYTAVAGLAVLGTAAAVGGRVNRDLHARQRDSQHRRTARSTLNSHSRA